MSLLQLNKNVSNRCCLHLLCLLLLGSELCGVDLSQQLVDAAAALLLCKESVHTTTHLDTHYVRRSSTFTVRLVRLWQGDEPHWRDQPKGIRSSSGGCRTLPRAGRQLELAEELGGDRLLRLIAEVICAKHPRPPATGLHAW